MTCWPQHSPPSGGGVRVGSDHYLLRRVAPKPRGLRRRPGPSAARGLREGTDNLTCWHFPFPSSFPERSLDTLSSFTALLLTSWQEGRPGGKRCISSSPPTPLFFISEQKSEQVWISYFRLVRTRLCRNNPSSPPGAETQAGSWYRPMVSAGSDTGF